MHACIRPSNSLLMVLFGGCALLVGAERPTNVPKKLVVGGDKAYWVLGQFAVRQERDRESVLGKSSVPQILSMAVGDSGVFQRRLLPTPTHVSFLTSWTVGREFIYCCYRTGALPPSPSFDYARIALEKLSSCPELPDLGTDREACLESSKKRVMDLLDGRATWRKDLVDETVWVGPLTFSHDSVDKRRSKTFCYDLVCRADGKVQVVLLEDDRLTGWVYRGTFENEVKWDVSFRGLIDHHAPMIACCVGGQSTRCKNARPPGATGQVRIMDANCVTPAAPNDYLQWSF